MIEVSGDSETLPATEALLVSGGDDRIALRAGWNQYGQPASPWLDQLAFGSSTASTISPGGFGAADAVRLRLVAGLPTTSPADLYRQGLADVRKRLLDLFDIEAGAAAVLLGASGTDMHRIAAGLLADASPDPLLIIAVQPSETGSGVPEGLAWARSDVETRVATFRVRDGNGDLLDEADVAREIDALIRATSRRTRILLVATDVTKTGLIAPATETVLNLSQDWGSRLTVFVDACQGRLSAETLKAYLASNFLVAITGSKFITGPAFCGALFVPPGVSSWLSKSRPPADFGSLALRGEIPDHWTASALLSHGSNFGLLLRWEAALFELGRFRAQDPKNLLRRTAEFGERVRQIFAVSHRLAPLQSRPLVRAGLAGAPSWDRLQTLFPFRIRRSVGDDRFFGLAEVAAVHGAMRVGDAALPPTYLGQPVLCGEQAAQTVGALRFCFSARLAGTAPDSATFSALLDRVDQVFGRLEDMTRLSETIGSS